MAEVNRRWVYPTVAVSQNKSMERIAVTGENVAYELVGIDGSRKFGCRPNSGFQHARTLSMLEDFSSEAFPPPTASKTSTVSDCFPIHFQIKENEFGFGFVYRVVTGGNAAIYMDFMPTLAVNASTSWQTILISDHSTDHVSPSADMDVVCMGRYVFTFVKGRACRTFYCDYDLGTTNFISLVIDGGPGETPILLNSEDTQPFDGATEPPRDPTSNPFDSTTAPLGRIVSTATDPDTDVDNPDRDYHLFYPGNYSFAYYLHNSTTGRRTALSTIAQRSEEDAPIDVSGRYLGITFDVDTEKFDQIFLFRSVKLQSVGGTYTGAILHLDNIYDIDDLKDSTPASAPYTGTNWKVKTAYYELDDIALAMQDIYLDKVSYESEIPYAGTAIGFGGSLIASDPLGPNNQPTYGPFTSAVSLANRIRNVGEIRWSSLTERSPELFPINNKYVPDVFQNRIYRLAAAGDFAVGFSRDRIYHIRRDSLYMMINDLHAGFGLAGRDAVSEAGPLIYFVTTKGLKAVSNNGQLDDVAALDNLILDDWYDDIQDLKLSFDPYSSCLFILNPNQDQIACLWFSTGRVSEIHDAPFTDLNPGIWPQDWNSLGASLPVNSNTVMVERTFFLQNAPSTLSANIPDGWEPRVYIFDFDRKKISFGGDAVSDGTSVLRTLDYTGDCIFEVENVTQSVGKTTITLKSDTTSSKTLSSGQGYDLVGAYVYLLSGSSIGSKAKIYKVVSGTAPVASGFTTAEITTEYFGGVRAGDKIALSPILFRMVGGALPMVRTEKDQVVTSFDMFLNKQVSSIGCHFSDVSGLHEGYQFFKGLVYNTDSDSAAVSAFPLDFAGTVIGNSIKVGESDDYAAFTKTGLTTTGRHGIQDSVLNPGVEIFCPDIDYKLMAMICRGRTTNTDTSERNPS